MDEIIKSLKALEKSMVEQGVSEEYGSWLLAVRYIIMLTEEKENGL